MDGEVTPSETTQVTMSTVDSERVIRKAASAGGRILTLSTSPLNQLALFSFGSLEKTEASNQDHVHSVVNTN